MSNLLKYHFSLVRREVSSTDYLIRPSIICNSLFCSIMLSFYFLKDGISRVTFGPNSSQFLLASSWDKKVDIVVFQATVPKLSFSIESFVLSSILPRVRQHVRLFCFRNCNLQSCWERERFLMVCQRLFAPIRFKPKGQLSLNYSLWPS